MVKQSFLVMLPLLLVPFAGSSMAAPSCEETNAYLASALASHPGAEESEPIYRDIRRESETAGKAVFRSQSATTKSALWLRHFSALSHSENLTPAQCEVLGDVARLLEPELFLDVESSKKAELEELLLIARFVFSPDLYRNAFLRIGNEDPAQRRRRVCSAVSDAELLSLLCDPMQAADVPEKAQ